MRATRITDEMCIAAACELANYAEKKGLSEDHIIPSMDDWQVYVKEAVAVGMCAVKQKATDMKISRAKLEATCCEIIKKSRDFYRSTFKIRKFPKKFQV